MCCIVYHGGRKLGSQIDIFSCAFQLILFALRELEEYRSLQLRTSFVYILVIWMNVKIFLQLLRDECVLFFLYHDYKISFKIFPV